MTTIFEMGAGEMLWTDEPEVVQAVHEPQYLWEQPALQLVEMTADLRWEPVWRDYGAIIRKFAR